LQLDRLGAGGDVLEIVHKPRRVSGSVSDSAQRLDIPLQQGRLDSHPCQQIVSTRTPAVVIRWADSEVDPRRDTLEGIDRVKLQAVGEMVNLALITVSREASWWR
jgi:hypothetical protein